MMEKSLLDDSWHVLHEGRQKDQSQEGAEWPFQRYKVFIPLYNDKSMTVIWHPPFRLIPLFLFLLSLLN